MKRFLIVILLTALLPDVSIWSLYLREVPLLVSILWFLPTTLLTAAWLALVFEFRHSLAARTLNGCILCFVVPKICFLLFQIITPWAGLLAAVTAELLAIYGLTLGWRRLKVRQVKICFPTLPAAFDGYRLLHLSDFHLGTFGRHNPFVRRVIETANQQEADLVVFTGDLVNKVAREAVPYRHDLAMLQAPDGVFAILGNHDYCKYGPKRRTGYHDRNFHQLGQVVRNVGWTLLLDEHRILQRGNDRIAIAGVENIGRPPFPVRGDLEKAVRGLEPDMFTILLSHDPNHWRAEVVGRKDIALTLAGHTHGAQVRIGPLSLARFAFKDWGGLYHKGAQWLYVSARAGRVVPLQAGRMARDDGHRTGKGITPAPSSTTAPTLSTYSFAYGCSYSAIRSFAYGCSYSANLFFAYAAGLVATGRLNVSFLGMFTHLPPTTIFIVLPFRRSSV